MGERPKRRLTYGAALVQAALCHDYPHHRAAEMLIGGFFVSDKPPLFAYFEGKLIGGFMSLVQDIKAKILSEKSFEKNELADMGPGEIPDGE